MPSRRKTIPLLPHEHAALKELYLVYRIPIDQYEQRPVDLRDFVEDWRAQTGRSDLAGELIHYMKAKRKQGKWVRLDGRHKTAPPPSLCLTAEQTETLVEIYEEHVIATGHCSDVLSENEELADLVAKEFAHRTRRRVPTAVLVARLTALRKRGLLPVVGTREENLGFRDIDDIDDVAV